MENFLRKFQLRSEEGEGINQVKRQSDEQGYMTHAREHKWAHTVGKQKESLAATECKRERF